MTLYRGYPIYRPVGVLSTKTMTGGVYCNSRLENDTHVPTHTDISLSVVQTRCETNARFYLLPVFGPESALSFCTCGSGTVSGQIKQWNQIDWTHAQTDLWPFCIAVSLLARTGAGFINEDSSEGRELKPKEISNERGHAMRKEREWGDKIKGHRVEGKRRSR